MRSLFMLSVFAPTYQWWYRCHLIVQSSVVATVAAACAEPVSLNAAAAPLAGHIVPLLPERDAGTGTAGTGTDRLYPDIGCGVTPAPIASPLPAPAVSAPVSPVDTQVTGAGGWAVVDAGGPLRPHGNAESRDAGLAPRPGPTAPELRGEVLITELMPDPKALPDREGEWLELRNDSERPLLLAGCHLGAPGASSPGIGVHVDARDPWPPGSYLTLARGPAPGFKRDGPLAVALPNGGHTLELRCGGRLIDRVTYGGPEGAPVVPGVAFSRIQTPLSVATAGTLLENAFCYGRTSYAMGELGSPGRDNDPCPYSDEPGGR